MRKFLNILLEELTENLVKPKTKKRTRRQGFRKTNQSELSTRLDKQLKELSEAFIPNEKKIRNDEPPTLSQDEEYWKKLSIWYRNHRKWTCEQCNLNLRKNKKFLDTHHVLGRGYNSPEHLMALCIGCHAEQKIPTDHSFMKNTDRYLQFVRTYRKRK